MSHWNFSLPACAVALMLVGAAQADVLTLSAQGDSSAVVRDAASGAATIGGIAAAHDRLLVEVGALAADAGHDIVYVATQADPAGSEPAAPSVLLGGSYGSLAPPAGSVAAPDGTHFQAIAFDVASSSLLGIVAGNSGAQLFTVDTQQGVALGIPTFTTLPGGCCRFLSGVSAWRASTQELFVVGWRNGDTDPQLLRFTFGGVGAAPSAYPIVDDRIVALAVDAQNGNLYALARSPLNFSYLATVTFAAEGSPATLSAIGSAPSTCCYAALGPAVIDGTGNARAFYALSRDAQMPIDMQLTRLPLVSGDAQIVNAAIAGFGLWSDAAASFDLIFADGFD